MPGGFEVALGFDIFVYENQACVPVKRKQAWF